MIINLGVNGNVLDGTEYHYSYLLANPYVAKTIIQYKDAIQTKITKETLQKAVRKIKNRKIKVQDIAKSTIELITQGSGGSELCDLVQADYQRLLDEKIKKKEGSEQGDTN